MKELTVGDRVIWRQPEYRKGYGEGAPVRPAEKLKGVVRDVRRGTRAGLPMTQALVEFDDPARHTKWLSAKTLEEERKERKEPKEKIDFAKLVKRLNFHSMDQQQLFLASPHLETRYYKPEEQDAARAWLDELGIRHIDKVPHPETAPREPPTTKNRVYLVESRKHKTYVCGFAPLARVAYYINASAINIQWVNVSLLNDTATSGRGNGARNLLAAPVATLTNTGYAAVRTTHPVGKPFVGQRSNNLIAFHRSGRIRGASSGYGSHMPWTRQATSAW
jgi:hypothetical protein